MLCYATDINIGMDCGCGSGVLSSNKVIDIEIDDNVDVDSKG